jgi:K+-transporting ATPase c subunit
MNSREVMMSNACRVVYGARRPQASNGVMNIPRYVSKGVLLLALGLVICSGLYTLSLSVIRQAIFPLQAHGMLAGLEIKVVGSSRQIAQPFTKTEHVQPRPSAASYDASASTSSAVAASNDIVDQNRDFGAAVNPSLQPSPQKICRFYDC